MKLYVILLFIATYALLIALPRHRAYVAVGAAALCLISGAIPLGEAFAAIDWNVLLMLTGTMGTVALFIASGMPARLADSLLRRVPSVMWAAAGLSLLAGVVSAFVDNVATVLMIAPVGLAAAKRLKLSPVPLLICISVSSNLQGAATLVGDTTSILLGGYAGMDFMDFIFMDGRFSIFWAVELGALLTVPVILSLFRKEKGIIPAQAPVVVTDYFPTWLLVGNIGLLIAASFFPGRPALTNGILCMAVLALGLLRTILKDKSLAPVKDVVSQIDGKTLALLAGLFILIAALTRAGVLEDLSAIMVKLGGGNLFAMYSIIVWGSVLLSAFVDNIPYVATMLPVVTSIATRMDCQPYVLYFGLLVGATLGGNLTPVGASANIAATGILQKEGYTVKTREFLRVGIPFTLVAVLTGYIFCWLVWANA